MNIECASAPPTIRPLNAGIDRTLQTAREHIDATEPWLWDFMDDAASALVNYDGDGLDMARRVGVVPDMTGGAVRLPAYVWELAFAKGSGIWPPAPCAA